MSMTSEYQGRLTRFLVHKSLYNSTKVKAAAFAPPKDGRLSVDKTEGRSEAEIWDDRKYVRPDEPDSIQARADFPSKVLSPLELQLEDAPDGEFLCHAEIVGWLQLDVVKQLAAKNKLAYESTLIQYTPNAEN